MKGKNKLVNPRFAKGGRYGKIIREIRAARVCPFCPKTFKWHTKPVLKREGDWLITENFNPYEDTCHHLLIIKRDHAEQLEKLTLRDWKSLSHLASWAIKKFKIRGGGIMMRFGETAFTGATVAHLHAHLIVPQLKNGKAKTVWFPIG